MHRKFRQNSGDPLKDFVIGKIYATHFLGNYLPDKRIAKHGHVAYFSKLRANICVVLAYVVFGLLS